METGMLARSRAGHDKEKIYIISSTEDAYVWLSDGRLRPLEKPKKKKKKHIQAIYTIPENLQKKLQEGKPLQNEDIKRAIKLYFHEGMRK
ncbi:MAG: 50S ribosomal protein L14 [Lachnospiraceae bacterium]|nr:50S ribosomal protein L14 [Lachnospiraceae bacterium]